jgi:hypothetical protein
MVTAAGNVPARNVAVYMKAVMEDGQRVIVDWHLEMALVSRRPGPKAVCLSSPSLEFCLHVSSY